MSAGTYAAAAAALGVGLEATGTTAVTPLGEQARQQGRSGPSLPQVPDTGADIGDVLAAVQAAQQGAERGDVNVDLSGLADRTQQGQQAGQVADAVARAFEEGRRRAEEAQDRADDARDGDMDGDGESDLSLPDWLLEQSDGSDTPDGDDGDDGDDFKLQDLDGRGPLGIGTGLAAGGEIGAATGETVDKSVGGLTKVGNTYSQVARAVAGKEYSAEDTLAEDIHGTETRRIDWGDYNPLSGVGGGLKDVGGGIKDAVQSQETGSAEGTVFDADSDQGGDDGDGEEPAPLPEELRRRLGGPTDLPAGGL